MTERIGSDKLRSLLENKEIYEEWERFFLGEDMETYGIMIEDNLLDEDSEDDNNEYVRPDESIWMLSFIKYCINKGYVQLPPGKESSYELKYGQYHARKRTTLKRKYDEVEKEGSEVVEEIERPRKRRTRYTTTKQTESNNKKIKPPQTMRPQNARQLMLLETIMQEQQSFYNSVADKNTIIDAHKTNKIQEPNAFHIVAGLMDLYNQNTKRTKKVALHTVDKVPTDDKENHLVITESSADSFVKERLTSYIVEYTKLKASAADNQPIRFGGLAHYVRHKFAGRWGIRNEPVPLGARVMVFDAGRVVLRDFKHNRRECVPRFDCFDGKHNAEYVLTKNVKVNHSMPKLNIRRNEMNVIEWCAFALAPQTMDLLLEWMDAGILSFGGNTYMNSEQYVYENIRTLLDTALVSYKQSVYLEPKKALLFADLLSQVVDILLNRFNKYDDFISEQTEQSTTNNNNADVVQLLKAATREYETMVALFIDTSMGTKRTTSSETKQRISMTHLRRVYKNLVNMWLRYLHGSTSPVNFTLQASVGNPNNVKITDEVETMLFKHILSEFQDSVWNGCLDLDEIILYNIPAEVLEKLIDSGVVAPVISSVLRFSNNWNRSFEFIKKQDEKSQPETIVNKQTHLGPIKPSDAQIKGKDESLSQVEKSTTTQQSNLLSLYLLQLVGLAKHVAEQHKRIHGAVTLTDWVPNSSQLRELIRDYKLTPSDGALILYKLAYAADSIALMKKIENMLLSKQARFELAERLSHPYDLAAHTVEAVGLWLKQRTNETQRSKINELYVLRKQDQKLDEILSKEQKLAQDTAGMNAQQIEAFANKLADQWLKDREQFDLQKIAIVQQRHAQELATLKDPQDIINKQHLQRFELDRIKSTADRARLRQRSVALQEIHDLINGVAHVKYLEDKDRWLQREAGTKGSENRFLTFDQFVTKPKHKQEQRKVTTLSGTINSATFAKPGRVLSESAHEHDFLYDRATIRDALKNPEFQIFVREKKFQKGASTLFPSYSNTGPFGCMFGVHLTQRTAHCLLHIANTYPTELPALLSKPNCMQLMFGMRRYDLVALFIQRALFEKIPRLPLPVFRREWFRDGFLNPYKHTDSESFLYKPYMTYITSFVRKASWTMGTIIDPLLFRFALYEQTDSGAIKLHDLLIALNDVNNRLMELNRNLSTAGTAKLYDRSANPLVYTQKTVIQTPPVETSDNKKQEMRSAIRAHTLGPSRTNYPAENEPYLPGVIDWKDFDRKAWLAMTDSQKDAKLIRLLHQIRKYIEVTKQNPGGRRTHLDAIFAVAHKRYTTLVKSSEQTESSKYKEVYVSLWELPTVLVTDNGLENVDYYYNSDSKRSILSKMYFRFNVDNAAQTLQDRKDGQYIFGGSPREQKTGYTYTGKYDSFERGRITNNGEAAEVSEDKDKPFQYAVVNEDTVPALLNRSFISPMDKINDIWLQQTKQHRTGFTTIDDDEDDKLKETFVSQYKITTESASILNVNKERDDKTKLSIETEIAMLKQRLNKLMLFSK